MRKGMHYSSSLRSKSDDSIVLLPGLDEKYQAMSVTKHNAILVGQHFLECQRNVETLNATSLLRTPQVVSPKLAPVGDRRNVVWRFS